MMRSCRLCQCLQLDSISIFNAETGADASVTNSNSNFGQFAIASDGFKKEHLQKIIMHISRK